jgi:hypothetical protein
MCAACFNASFLLVLFFDPDDGGDMLLWNVGWLSAGYTALYPRRDNSSRHNMSTSTVVTAASILCTRSSIVLGGIA